MKHILGFSGGVDSQAAAGQLLEKFDPADVILLNSDAGKNEHPLTTEFVNWYSANIHEVIPIMKRGKPPGNAGETWTRSGTRMCSTRRAKWLPKSARALILAREFCCKGDSMADTAVVKLRKEVDALLGEQVSAFVNIPGAVVAATGDSLKDALQMLADALDENDQPFWVE